MGHEVVEFSRGAGVLRIIIGFGTAICVHALGFEVVHMCGFIQFNMVTPGNFHHVQGFQLHVRPTTMGTNVKEPLLRNTSSGIS